LLSSPKALSFREQKITFDKIIPTTYHLSPEQRKWLERLKDLNYSILLNRSLNLNSRLMVLGAFFKDITAQKAQKQINLLNQIYNQLNFAIAFP